MDERNILKLGDIASYINGYPFSPSDRSDKGVPIIRIQDLTGSGGSMNRYNGKYEKKYEINSGDILISWSASLGVYEWTGEKAVLNQHIFKVVFDKERVSKRFFLHQTARILENASLIAHGATMKHLTRPVFDSLPFYLPPPEEQDKIAAVLDKVTELINIRKKQLLLLDTLLLSRFSDIFGDAAMNTKAYPVVSLPEIAVYRKGLTYKPRDISKIGTPVLRSGNIRDNGLYLGDVVRVSCNVKEEFLLRENDILMCARNGSARLVGKTALIKNLPEKMSFGAFMTVIRSEYHTYLAAYFRLEAFRRQIASGTTSTINQITCGMLDSVRIPLPDKTALKEFSGFAEEQEKAKESIGRSLEKLELLKRSLLREYFG